MGALACALIALASPNWAKALAFLGWSFFLVAWSSAQQRQAYFNTVSLLPKGEAIFTGIINESAREEDASVTLLVSATDISDAAKTEFNLRLRLSESAANLPVEPGRTMRFSGKALPLNKPMSPIHFDAARFGLAHNIHGSLSITDVNLLWIGERVTSPYFATLRESFKQRVLSVISPREAAILLALMIGDTHLFDRDQNEVFRSIGAEHLLAVSGLQVTLLAALGFVLLCPLVSLLLPARLFHYGRGITAILTLVAILWFVGLAGFSNSAMRAFLMTAFLLANTLIVRKIDPLDALFASGFITLVCAPMAVLDLGFWLSYSAVLGLLVAHARSESLMVSLKGRSLLLSYGTSLVISSMAAFLATLPIIAATFRTIAPMSIVANLILVPCATVLQVPAIIFGLLGCLFHWPALISLASFFGNLVEILAEFLAHLFGLITYLPPLSSIALVLLLTALNLLFWCTLKRSRVMAAISCLLLIMPTYQLMANENVLKVFVIPVGQGDATLFSFPSGETMLIDAGGQTYGNYDPGERIVLPSLRQKGVHKLDILAISHPDPDHIQGAFVIIEKLPIKEIWHSGFHPDHPLTKKLLALATARHITVKTTKDLLGSHKFGQSEVVVLAPQSQGDYFPELTANDNSLVIKIIHGQNALLWPGDLEYFGEHLLLASGVNVRASVLKAPHHGSKTSSTNELLAAIKPAHVIYSTGSHNRFGFPHQEVVARYRRLGVMEWNTATDGEITINMNRNKISIDGYQKPFKEKSRALPLAKETTGQRHESSNLDQQSLRQI